MIRRLILVLQSISLIPPIGMFIVWLHLFLKHYPFVGESYGYGVRDSQFHFVIFLLSCVPFTLLILGKFIVQGKFYIFKEKVDEQ